MATDEELAENGVKDVVKMVAFAHCKILTHDDREIWYNTDINPLGSASAAQGPGRKVGALAFLET